MLNRGGKPPPRPSKCLPYLLPGTRYFVSARPIEIIMQGTKGVTPPTTLLVKETSNIQINVVRQELEVYCRVAKGPQSQKKTRLFLLQVVLLSQSEELCPTPKCPFSTTAYRDSTRRRMAQAGRQSRVVFFCTLYCWPISEELYPAPKGYFSTTA